MHICLYRRFIRSIMCKSKGFSYSLNIQALLDTRFTLTQVYLDFAVRITDAAKTEQRNFGNVARIVGENALISA